MKLEPLPALRMPVPQETWIPRKMQGEVVAWMIEAGLIKHDNSRNLPLKKGGFTDVYVNLRNARSHPDALRTLAELYAYPLRWLEPDLFVEVPDAVSCFAGPLAVELGMPYTTVRAQAKESRATDANIIGSCESGQSVVIIDDVITNGASKVLPYRACLDKNLQVQAFVVLVDRQQGWREDFRELGIRMPVWAGMTLHDVRRELVQMGAMMRCDYRVEDSNPMVIALDGKSWEEILPLVEQLRPTGCILKVNDLLFAKGIEHLLPELSTYGRVMADLKCHDIPQTVENACKHLRICPPWAMTVHASGSGEMVKAAKKGLAHCGTKVLAITVLTSHNKESCEEVYRRRPLGAVKHLAQIAWDAGADGFVCSPEEAPHLRKMFPNALIVTPGVRSPGKDTHDQKRVATPAEAMRCADHIVMGRHILGADDPVAEVRRVLSEELKIDAFSQSWWQLS
ncbi:orotidine-5'-phosphate decarboxylase [Patescibacteria group bacterium]|nr:orotidine-5'-phosphate decarboxylase [Patescibacteria group bacterium]